MYISYTFTYPCNFWYTFENHYIYIYTWGLEKRVHNSARVLLQKKLSGNQILSAALLYRRRQDWTVAHPNIELCILTSSHPVAKTVALKFLILRPHFDMDSTYWFLIIFWPIFEGNHFESIPKVRRACICIAEWSMLNAEWWMLNDEWWMMNDDGWWMMNDEWRMTNDEWWTIIHIHTL